MTANTAPVAMRGIDHACVRVEDFDRAVAWYGEKLGFSIEKRWRAEQLPDVEMAYLSGPSGARIEIIGGGDSCGAPGGGNFMEQFAIRGWNHVCFHSDDVDATVADLASRGVPAVLPPTDFPEAPDKRIAIVQDLDGNFVEFIGPLRSPQSR